MLCPFFVKLEKSKSMSGFKVLTIGQPSLPNSLSISINAFYSFLKQQEKDVDEEIRLWVVGDIQMKQQTQELAEKLKIVDKVDFRLFEQVDIKGLLSKVDVFLFPAHEGANIAVAEALSFGVPVLCFANEKAEELVDHSCGFKIPYTEYYRSSTQFAEFLNMIYADPMVLNLLSKGAKKLFRRKFLWNKKGKAVIQTFSEMFYQGAVPVSIRA